MASMVNRPLASHFTIDVTWQSSQANPFHYKIHGEFRSSCTCLQLLYGLHTTPPIDSRVHAGRV